MGYRMIHERRQANDNREGRVTKDRRQNGLIRVKGTDRIQIINILAAACIAILSVLLGLSGQRFSGWMIVQLAVATPLLVTSSLAYAKVGYRDVNEYPIWDGLGWATLSLGYIMTLNALAIMLHTSGYVGAYWWFIGTTVFLYVTYSMLDVVARKDRLREKAWKLMVYLVLIFAGAALPILAGWA
jgi:hypothetical protein